MKHTMNQNPIKQLIDQMGQQITSSHALKTSWEAFLQRKVNIDEMHEWLNTLPELTDSQKKELRQQPTFEHSFYAIITRSEDKTAKICANFLARCAQSIALKQGQTSQQEEQANGFLQSLLNLYIKLHPELKNHLTNFSNLSILSNKKPASPQESFYQSYCRIM